MGSFEELEVWNEGCNIAIAIYEETKEGVISKDFGLCDQMRRSSLSIPSNIAEGKERETVNELIRYLYIAKGSAAELKTQLIVAHKVGYLQENRYLYLKEKVNHISGMLGNFIKNLKKRKVDSDRKRQKACEE